MRKLNPCSVDACFCVNATAHAMWRFGWVHAYAPPDPRLLLPFHAPPLSAVGVRFWRAQLVAHGHHGVIAAQRAYLALWAWHQDTGLSSQVQTQRPWETMRTESCGYICMACDLVTCQHDATRDHLNPSPGLRLGRIGNVGGSDVSISSL
jgi:hypothetical protein